MQFALGLDVGTQGVKALLVDAHGAIAASASAPLSTIDGLPQGHSEQHPADWLAAIDRCLARLRDTHDLGTIVAIGVSGQQHGLVPLDAEHRVIRPAKLWNDVASALECAAIVAAVGGPDALFARTGNALPPGFTAGKVAWLRNHEPEHFARLRHVLLPHDYVNLHLTGTLGCEAGDASGTGVFDVRARRFDDVVCEATAPGLRAMLPPLVDAGTAIGALRVAFAARHGLREGIPVATGGGDNMMAAIGSGAVRDGIAVVSLGTSGTVFASTTQPICDPGGEVAAFCDSAGGWLPLGCTMNATVATEVTRGMFAASLDAFESAIGATHAGAAGVLCVPYFTGERSPDLPTATGAFLGLTPSNASAANVLRAAVEGATFAIARLFHRLVGLGVTVDEVRLTGGGSRSPTWCRIVAAALDRPVALGVPADAAAYGAATQAWWTLRRIAEPALALATVVDGFAGAHPLQRIAPDPTDAALYRTRLSDFCAVVDALAPTFPRIGRQPL